MILNFLFLVVIVVFEIRVSNADVASYAVDNLGRRVVQDEPPIVGVPSRAPRAVEYGDACRTAHVETNEQTLMPIKFHNVKRYEIGRVVGAGTYSQVKLARDTESKATVVLKFLTKSNLTVLFPREVLMLRQIGDIKYAVHLLDIVGDASKPALVFPYVHAVAPQDLWNSLRWSEIVEYTRRILYVLDKAHSRCIIHGDLKPLNVTSLVFFVLKFLLLFLFFK